MVETLRHYSKIVLSYINDTGHFLKIIKDVEVNNEDIISTIDVSALSKQIQYTEGIKATRQNLEKNIVKITEIQLISSLLYHILNEKLLRI